MIELCLERARLSLQPAEVDQRLTAGVVDLAVVVRNLGDLVRGRIRPGLQRLQQRRQIGLCLGEDAPLFLERVALAFQLMG